MDVALHWLEQYAQGLARLTQIDRQLSAWIEYLESDDCKALDNAWIASTLKQFQSFEETTKQTEDVLKQHSPDIDYNSFMTRSDDETQMFVFEIPSQEYIQAAIEVVEEINGRIADIVKDFSNAYFHFLISKLRQLLKSVEAAEFLLLGPLAFEEQTEIPNVKAEKPFVASATYTKALDSLNKAEGSLAKLLVPQKRSGQEQPSPNERYLSKYGVILEELQTTNECLEALYTHTDALQAWLNESRLWDDQSSCLASVLLDAWFKTREACTLLQDIAARIEGRPDSSYTTRGKAQSESSAEYDPLEDSDGDFDAFLDELYVIKTEKKTAKPPKISNAPVYCASIPDLDRALADIQQIHANLSGQGRLLITL